MPANTPRLETERLVLRRFTPADVEPLFSLMRDREVNTFLPWFPLETEADAARYLEEHYLDYYRRPSGCRYAICLRENDRPIGYLHVDDGESHDLGYALARPSWGRGYMTEAAAAVVERLRADGLEAFMDFWEQLPLFASQRDLPPDVRERLRAGRMANDAEALARTFEQAGQHVMPSRAETLETLDVLRAGDTPLLYLAGERDEKYRALAAQAAEAGATVRIIPGAGHNAHLEAPATFAKEVASFLRK